MWHASQNNPPRICADDDFGEPGRFAIDELRRCWSAVLGAAEGDGPAIRLRRGSGDLTDEGYELETTGGELILHAGGALGAVFGAYGLMRHVARCRFAGLGPGGERLPRRQSVAVDFSCPRRFVPRLWYRGLQFYYNDGLELTRLRIDWMAKNGFNYLTYTPRSEYEVDRSNLQFDTSTGDEVMQNGKRSSVFSKVWFDRFVLPEVVRRGLKLDYNHHNLRSWLHPRQHFATHSDWFAQIDGARSDSARQLSICTSNPEAVGRLIENVRVFLRQNPQVSIVGVIPDDGFGMCECPACVALDDDPSDVARSTQHHRDPAVFNASKSRRYAALLNDVANALAEEFPNVLVGGSAYIDLQWPPRDIPLAANTTIWLAIFWRDGCRPLAMSSEDAAPSAKLNDFFVDLIRQWRGTYQGRLILYEYPMGMERHRSLPYPMLDVVISEWQFLKQLGVVGFTLQCTGENHQSYALNLLAYAAVAQQDRVDRNAIMRDYLICVFGRAARTVRPLFEALHHATHELAKSRPGDEAWEQITRCQKLRNAQPTDVDYLPPHRKSGILQPTGESLWYLWRRLKPLDPMQMLARARKQAVASSEIENLEAMTETVRYWQLSADYFDLKMRAMYLEESAPGEARALRQRADSAITDIQKQIDRIVPGSVTPQTVRRWNAARDLSAKAATP